jgi:hypothetical protein
MLLANGGAFLDLDVATAGRTASGQFVGVHDHARLGCTNHALLPLGLQTPQSRLFEIQ